MKLLVCYSSLTGNTKIIAEAIYEKLKSTDESDITCDLKEISEDICISDYDGIIVGYWADKGIADVKADKFMDKVTGKPAGVFATLGAYPDSDHGKKVISYGVEKLKGNGCNVISSFICQGKINKSLSEMFKKYPEGHPHYMDEERIKRHKESQKHPDEEDRKNAAEAFKNFISEFKMAINGKTNE